MNERSQDKSISLSLLFLNIANARVERSYGNDNGRRRSVVKAFKFYSEIKI